MCGRYALSQGPSTLTQTFALDACADFQARYNIAPGTDIPVVRQSPEGQRVLHLLHWGLIPHWAKEATVGTKLNNARAETLSEKPSFRDAFRKRRCLIPASGFYEWQSTENGKQPHFISLKSGEPMAMAGLWESWKAPDGSILRSACVITTAPNELMAPIHDRMPVIVAPEHWARWLTATAEDVEMLLAPASAEGMQAWQVDRRVNRIRDDDELLTAPAQGDGEL